MHEVNRQNMPGFPWKRIGGIYNWLFLRPRATDREPNIAHSQQEIIVLLFCGTKYAKFSLGAHYKEGTIS